MNISFYITNGNCGLKFDTTNERDAFWASLAQNVHNGFCAQAATERIGNRTLRFYPDKMKNAFELGLMTRNDVNQPQAVNPNRPKPGIPAIPPPPQSATITTVNPFSSLANNPTRALAGLSPAPPAELLADQQPVAAVIPEPEPVVSEPATKEAVETAPPEISDPEPPDKRKREWKEWKARQK